MRGIVVRRIVKNLHGEHPFLGHVDVAHLGVGTVMGLEVEVETQQPHVVALLYVEGRRERGIVAHVVIEQVGTGREACIVEHAQRVGIIIEMNG